MLQVTDRRLLKAMRPTNHIWRLSPVSGQLGSCNEKTTLVIVGNGAAGTNCDGQLELSNNLADNAIRPIAVVRKNWLHAGSERAGPLCSIERLAWNGRRASEELLRVWGKTHLSE